MAIRVMFIIDEKKTSGSGLKNDLNLYSSNIITFYKFGSSGIEDLPFSFSEDNISKTDKNITAVKVIQDNATAKTLRSIMLEKGFTFENHRVSLIIGISIAGQNKLCLYGRDVYLDSNVSQYFDNMSKGKDYNSTAIAIGEVFDKFYDSHIMTGNLITIVLSSSGEIIIRETINELKFKLIKEIEFEEIKYMEEIHCIKEEKS